MEVFLEILRRAFPMKVCLETAITHEDGWLRVSTRDMRLAIYDSRVATSDTKQKWWHACAPPFALAALTTEHITPCTDTSRHAGNAVYLADFPDTYNYCTPTAFVCKDTCPEVYRAANVSYTSPRDEYLRQCETIIEVETFQFLRHSNRKYRMLRDPCQAEIVALWIRGVTETEDSYVGTDRWYMQSPTLMPTLRGAGLHLAPGMLRNDLPFMCIRDAPWENTLLKVVCFPVPERPNIPESPGFVYDARKESSMANGKAHWKRFDPSVTAVILQKMSASEQSFVVDVSDGWMNAIDLIS